MGCSEGRTKPLKIEVQPAPRLPGSASRILQMSVCLPFIATLHSADGCAGFISLWNTADTQSFLRPQTFTPQGSESTETIKAIATATLDTAEGDAHRLLFAACVYAAGGPLGSRENDPKMNSLIRVWNVNSSFDRPEEMREFAPGEELQSVAASEECLAAVSSAWLYVWTCRATTGGRKSVYRNPVFCLSFQMSLGHLSSPSVLSIQTVDGKRYEDLREKSRLCVCGGLRRDASPPSSRHSLPFAVVVTQEDSEMAHRVQVVDLKANVSKEFTLATTNVSCCRLLGDCEALVGVYTERYHCEIWRVTLSGEVTARVSFQTSSKRLSLNPLDKFMSEKSARMASPTKRGKFSSPIIEMMLTNAHRGSALTVICADGYMAVYALEGFKCEKEFRVNLMCDAAVFAQSFVFIGDKTGHVHKILSPTPA